MKFDTLSFQAASILEELPEGPRVAVIGSTSLWHRESQATCEAVGRRLASFKGLILLTGGVTGAGEAVGRSFFAARSARKGHRGVFHILPIGSSNWDYGRTVLAGKNMQERREILGRLAECYVVIEGGPGTAHEASVALQNSACVIPVGRSGGYAAELYPQIPRPAFASESAWRDLARPDASADTVAEAVGCLVRGHLR